MLCGTCTMFSSLTPEETMKHIWYPRFQIKDYPEFRSYDLSEAGWIVTFSPGSAECLFLKEERLVRRLEQEK